MQMIALGQLGEQADPQAGDQNRPDATDQHCRYGAEPGRADPGAEIAELIGRTDKQAVDRADAAAIATLASPDIRIVSLTITEGGYFIDAATGKFDPDHPAILADAKDPANPKTVFGLIIAGLKARRAAGIPAFTVMCCDNIPGNGEVTEATVCGLARLSDPEIADWIHHNVAFPNSMVDRITPATGPREIDITRDSYGIEDGWPVFCEMKSP